MIGSMPQITRPTHAASVPTASRLPKAGPPSPVPRRERSAWTGRALGLAVTAGLLTWVTGCALQSQLEPATRLKPGQDEAAVVAVMGSPNARHALPGGARRLEFARGPLGFETWMVDMDPAGRVTRVEQVLNPRRFAEVRRGMDEAELVQRLGRPSARQRQYLDRVTLYWRHSPYDCVMFGVTMSPQGKALDSGGDVPDPRCDVSQ